MTSMGRTRPRLALASFVLLGLCVAGCDLRAFRVRIPHFETAQVQGLWVWRAEPSGEFVRFAQIEFGELAEEDGVEYLPYSVAVAGSPMVLNSPVVRAPTAPEDVTLCIALRNEVGTYKVSSYNAVGESPLSDGSMVY